MLEVGGVLPYPHTVTRCWVDAKRNGSWYGEGKIVPWLEIPVIGSTQ